MIASPIGRTLARSLRPLGLALLAGLASAGAARAQSIGLEVGLAGVENYDAFTPAIGVSLSAPFTERLRASASYVQWTGCDAGDCSEPRTGYGNHGFNVLGLFRAFGNEMADISLGAGLAWYEVHRLSNGASDARYDTAITFATELRRAVAYNSSMYVRGEASIPTEDNAFRWGFVRVGVDVRPF